MNSSEHAPLTQGAARSHVPARQDIHFRQLARHVPDALFLRTLGSGRFLYVSPAFEPLWGRSCASLYADPRTWEESIHPEDRDRIVDLMREARAAGFDTELRIIHPDGAARWIRLRESPVLNEAGAPYRVAGIASSISGSSYSAQRVNHLHRVHAMFSRINSLIVRVRTRDELFKETCQIAVEAGAFKMAWIGAVDPKTLDGAVLASHGGHERYLSQVRFTARAGTPHSERPASRVFRSREPLISNDIARDASLPLGPELTSQGFKSTGYFPLLVEGRCEAVFAVFAGETGVFDANEIHLLQQLADDISYALDNLQKTAQLAYIAFYDPLTGLANRSLFLERVAQYLRSALSNGRQVAVCLMDLEHFKSINDTFGRLAGDDLLKQTARWLTQSVGDASLLARVGADLFAVVLPDLRHEEEVAALLDSSSDAFLHHPFKLNDTEFRIAAKMGVALFPGDGENAETLFGNAEAALKKAKVGGDRYLFYAEQMTQTVAGRLTLEFRLRQALANEEFVLYYQPKFDVAGALQGAEALIRWNDPQNGLVAPDRFIPILEESGLILAVGRWALRKAIADHIHWREAGLPCVRVAVNVSASQLGNREFIGDVAQIIGQDARAAEALELEITESVVMEDIRLSIKSLTAIRELGATVAIDDFGTGFSSLSYLAKLPVDTLKIDRSFIRDMNASPQGLALVSTIINLGHSMHLKVVAEGVETDEQAAVLRGLGCDQLQGFLLGRPVGREQFERTYLRGV